MLRVTRVIPAHAPNQWAKIPFNANCEGRDDTARAALLEAHRGSARRPYVVIAMIRIAATLSKITKVTHGFAEQLSKNAYVYIEDGILNITDPDHAGGR